MHFALTTFVYRICPVVVIMRCLCVVMTVVGSATDAETSVSFGPDAAACAPISVAISDSCADCCCSDWLCDGDCCCEFGDFSAPFDTSSTLIFVLSSSLSVTCPADKREEKINIKLQEYRCFAIYFFSIGWFNRFLSLNLSIYFIFRVHRLYCRWYRDDREREKRNRNAARRKAFRWPIHLHTPFARRLIKCAVQLMSFVLSAKQKIIAQYTNFYVLAIKFLKYILLEQARRGGMREDTFLVLRVVRRVCACECVCVYNKLNWFWALFA